MKFKVEESRVPWFGTRAHVEIVSGRFPKSRLASLRASHAKWKAIIDYLDTSTEFLVPFDGADDTCACCANFLNKGGADDRPGVCHECPIKQHTGRTLCNGTPYTRYVNALLAFQKAKTDRGKRAAKQRALIAALDEDTLIMHLIRIERGKT
jgi:hypothetical protein